MITALQFIVFFGYLFIIYKRFGILQSISHSAYKWVGYKRYWFMAMCWLLAGLNLAQGMGGYGVLTSTGLLFAGITVRYLDNPAHSLYLHYIGAKIAIISAFLGLIFLHGIILPLGLFALSCVLIIKFSKNPIWWLEVTAFSLILSGYALR